MMVTAIARMERGPIVPPDPPHRHLAGDRAQDQQDRRRPDERQDRQLEGFAGLRVHRRPLRGARPQAEVEQYVVVGANSTILLTMPPKLCWSATGTAGRLPERVRSLVYLDTLLPQDGQRAWDLIIEPVRRRFLNTTEDGLTHLAGRMSLTASTVHISPAPTPSPSTFDARQGCMTGVRAILRRHIRCDLPAPVGCRWLVDGQRAVPPRPCRRGARTGR